MPVSITRKVGGVGNGTLVSVAYTGLSETDTSPRPMELAEYPERSVQVAGTFNGGSVVIEGSNNGIDWQTLTDPQGNALVFNAPRVERIQELTFYTRPRVSSGTGVSANVGFLVARSALESDFETMAGDVSQIVSDLSALTATVSTLSTQTTTLTSTVSGLTTVVDDATQDISTLATMVAPLPGQLSTLDFAVVSLGNQVSDATAAVAAQQTALTGALGRLTTAEGAISTLNTTVGGLGTTTSALQTTTSQLQTAQATLEGIITNLNEADVAETATFKKFTDTLKTQLEGLLAALVPGIPVVAGKVNYPLVDPGLLVVSVSSASAIEGQTLVHTVTLNQPTEATELVTYSISDVTTGADDYLLPPVFSNGVTAAGGVLSIPAGVLSFTVSVTAVADALTESPQYYTLTVGGASGTGTISDAPSGGSSIWDGGSSIWDGGSSIWDGGAAPAVAWDGGSSIWDGGSTVWVS